MVKYHTQVVFGKEIIWFQLKKYSTQIQTSSRRKFKFFNMVDIWPLTFENMWLPVEVWYDLKFLWRNRYGPKHQFWVSLQHIYELIGDQIPKFPLTLHWNQKYQKAQVTISVNLYLKPLSLTFPRRQKQCPRKTIAALDLIDRWSWNDMCTLYLKCTDNALDQKYGDFEFQIATLSEFYKKAIFGHVEVIWPEQGCFYLFATKNPRWWTCQ